MKTIAIFYFLLLVGVQCFAQFKGNKADFGKLKTYFDKMQAGQYLPFAASLQESNLPKGIVEIMGMTSLKLSTAKDAKHVYKAIGYYDHNEKYATFFYFSFIPEQPDYSPLASLHVQTIDKSTWKAITHQNWGNKMSSSLKSLMNAWSKELYTSYEEESEILFRKEKMVSGSNTEVEEGFLIYLDIRRRKYLLK